MEEKNIKDRDVRVGDRITVFKTFRGVRISETLLVDRKSYEYVYTVEGERVTIKGRDILLIDRPKPPAGSLWVDPETNFLYALSDRDYFKPVKTPGVYSYVGDVAITSRIGDRLVPFEGEL